MHAFQKKKKKKKTGLIFQTNFKQLGISTLSKESSRNFVI